MEVNVNPGFFSNVFWLKSAELKKKQKNLKIPSSYLFFLLISKRIWELI